MKPNPKVLIALTVLTLFGGAGACYWQYGNLTSAETRVKSLKKEALDEATLKTQLEHALVDLDESAKKLAHLEQSVSQAEYIPTLLKEIENVGRQNGLAVLGVRPLPKQVVKGKKGEEAKPERKPYVELNIEIRGRGTYKAVLNFVNALQTFPKIVAARTVSLQPKAVKDDPRINLDTTIELRTYLFLPPRQSKLGEGEKTVGLMPQDVDNHG